ncbi:hypothetical protein [Halomarina litorea]|uniref:hypothetical protein n=1 Tax=Halomarina litorea TaxID=2961595 RepID=UPI0020C1BB82|nr:hypothetical protein [Halomarina sp. BCD28]
MEYSRRRFLAAAATTAGTPLFIQQAAAHPADPPSCYESRQYNHPTPTAPDQPAHDAVIAEAYGELVLNANRPYWVWPVCSISDPVTIEYEVRTSNRTATPSILVADDEGFRKYETKVRDHPLIDGPLISTTTEDLGRLGSWDVPTGVNTENVHPWNLFKQGDSRQPWDEDSSIVDLYTLQCLNSAETGSVRRHHTIEPGRYYVIFDWTDGVLHSPTDDQVAAQVSLRASHSVEDQVTETAPATMAQLYGQLAGGSSPVVTTAVSLAEAICRQVPEEFQDVSLTEINAVAPRTGQLVSSVNLVLTIVADQLGFSPSIMDRVTARTSVWTRWGLSVLPVASSIDQLLNDACAVAAADPAEVTDDVENMLMSLGILVADLVAAYFGVAGRAGAFVTRFAHKYLLGFVARTLSLRTYLVLLRELYTLTRSGVAEVLRMIKAVTRTIARKYEFLSDDDIESVEKLDRRSLHSLDLDIDLFSLSPECTT